MVCAPFLGKGIGCEKEMFSIFFIYIKNVWLSYYSSWRMKKNAFLQNNR